MKVPVIFRPWQENGENHFWWDDSVCTKEQYLALWQMTQVRMKENDVVNVLYAYSPVATEDASESHYLARYPGDEQVDILGINYYCHAEEGDTAALATFTKTLDKNLTMLTTLGKKQESLSLLQKQVIAALRVTIGGPTTYLKPLANILSAISCFGEMDTNLPITIMYHSQVNDLLKICQVLQRTENLIPP